MVNEPERCDLKERAREKQRSREEDARGLASGEKTREQLRRENGHFVFSNVRISARGSKPLECCPVDVREFELDPNQRATNCRK